MESLTVYNSISRKKEVFEPLKPPFVGMYVCGPTVYGDAHLGHARSAITFDTVFRYLQYLGYKVRYVRNITDVGHLENDGDEGDSKVEKQARVEQLEPMEVAQRYYNSYVNDMTALNLLRPSIEPRATGHVPEQIEAIQEILKNGYAYVVNGSVYFDVEAYHKDFHYGILSGRDLENMMAESRDNLEGQGEKKNSADFALWKNASPSHIMRWNSPWGEGFPGWHIECTVMGTKYLGIKYDIHGGGMDLIFPHHEAEIAQSNACNCKLPEDQQGEAKYWLHNNMITYEGQKMGKSLGNAINLHQFFSGEHPLLEQAYTPANIRFFILQAHYRSTLDFSNQALQAADKALKRMTDTIKRMDTLDPDSRTEVINPEFEENLASFAADVTSFMNDDFNTAKVIARMFDTLPVINQLFKDKTAGFAVKAETFRNFRTFFHTVFSGWLGLKPVSEEGSQAQETINGLMKVIIQLRGQARKEKNWAASDLIRDELSKVNIKLEDTKEGTDWYYEQ
ncbi:MAG: cysteine--tRNA ligase [Bacteroidia bacterium]|nr:cysteine--tRNA ligase [Bacteroidia bacterium]